MELLSDIIKHSDRNKMTLSNLAICIVPSLDCVPAIVTYTLQNYDYFFKETSSQQNPALESTITTITNSTATLDISTDLRSDVDIDLIPPT